MNAPFSIVTKICGSLDDDRSAFLESVGLEILEISRPENVYEVLFEPLR